MIIEENNYLKNIIVEHFREKHRSKPPKDWKTVSQLISCPRKTYFRITQPEKEYIGDEAILKMDIGRVYHEIFEFYPISELSISKDGVSGTVDMIGEKITEIKTTRASKKKPIEENILWLKQIMGYCYILDKKEADLIVIYLVNGSIKCYSLTFTEEELKENWLTILCHKYLIEESLAANEPPEEYQTEECEYCGFKKLCPNRPKPFKIVEKEEAFDIGLKQI